MIKKLAAGTTFCALPWISNFTNTQGHRSLCCWSQHLPITDNGDSVRQRIWDGEKVPHCASCYKLEENKVISPRQRESIYWLKYPDINAHLNSDVCPSYKPVFFDIRLSNKCNLSCVGCNPEESSLWARELGRPDVERVTAVNMSELMQAKKVYLAGGEPFLIDECIDVITAIASNNPDVELSITTNLTTVPADVISAIKRIKKTSVTVSLDAYGKVNEYHRYPMKWDKFIRNLDELRNSGISMSFNTVIDSVSVFGFEQLYLLENYVNSWMLSLLTKPEALRLNNLPDQTKDLAIANLHSLQNIKFYKTDIEFKFKVDRALELVNEKGNSASLSAYIQTLDQRRQINHTEFLGVNLIET